MKEIPTGTTEQVPKEEKFNFPEIEAIKEGMMSLCKKMKEVIDSGKYTALVSDEIGGRIPTLIIRKIIKRLHSDKELKTLFVASGKGSDLPDYGEAGYEDLKNYFNKIIISDDNVLLVTQYVHRGETIQKLVSALRDSVPELKSLDVGIMDSLEKEADLRRGIIKAEDEDRNYAIFKESGMMSHARPVPIEADNIWTGGYSGSHMKLDEKHNRYTGVAKNIVSQDPYSPSPILYTKAIEKYGRSPYLTQEEWRKVNGLEDGDVYEKFDAKMRDPERAKRFEEFSAKPLSDDEKKEIIENIRKTREDIDTMAQVILKEVWNV